MRRWSLWVVPGLAVALAVASSAIAANNPFDRQVAEQLERLTASSPQVRTAAIESLGFLRAYEAEGRLLVSLDDDSAEVRRAAAMSLAWCGGRASVARLLKALNDPDWLVRQGAHTALTNLTGMEFPFDATLPEASRAAQARVWQDWWATVPDDLPPQEVLDLLVGPRFLSWAVGVSTSTTYKGPPDVLVDGQIGPEYWQTKNVEPPQWCTVDLGRERTISRVAVHQYGAGYCMTEYALATSLDGERFDVVEHKRGLTPVELIIDFPARQARFVRVTSFGSERPVYPTTFFEIEVEDGQEGSRQEGNPAASSNGETAEWRLERGLRALGALGGRDATEIILEVLGSTPPTAPAWRGAVRAGIRSLGRLREEKGFEALVGYLDNTMWARSAADALGDYGDRRAVAALLAAYPKYCKRLDGSNPAAVPADDQMSFPSEDRMLETPYWMIYALCRLPLEQPDDLDELRRLAPLVMANLPGDFDTFMLYEPEVGHILTRHLLDAAGMRQEACEQAMLRLGQSRRVPPPGGLASDDAAGAAAWSDFPPERISSWLPAVCTESEDLPRLVALLEHENGWVRINAAKALAWIGDRRAIGPIASTLAAAPAEADYGYSGTFKDEEYNDPAPRWREAFLRALGKLGARQHTDMIAAIMNDERSVLEVRRAAADALSDLGGPAALAALGEAARQHDFRTIQHTARDALRARGIDLETPPGVAGPFHSGLWPAASPNAPSAGSNAQDVPPAIVFVKGDNDVPNTPQTVEQADRWRQTYVVTDEGPEYRPGENLFVLSPPDPGGSVRPLTRFDDGYVASPDVCWDGEQVVFTHRGKEDPWWQVFVIRADGTGLRQLTHGPYHHVGPAWLPDGRIVVATSRIGLRDEYHGYPCTALYVMNSDGSDLHPIATNIGRDNEPTVLHDGRIAFSRLEVFYSRNKTELTLHAMRADGLQDVVLYGPERRQFWRSLDHGDPDPADVQEAPLTHRVLRMTQPQAMPDGRQIVVSTQGGLALIGPNRLTETFISPDFRTRAYTTPWPLADGRLLCAATDKTPDRKKVDLGLYVLDPVSGRMELIYNDPQRADYEPRPLMARRKPPVQPILAERTAYSGRFFCASVFNTQEKELRTRGRLVRLVEGVPQVGRHSTHTNPNPVWQNHGGTLGRVLGMAPLAADGSFYAEVPADRLLHLQVLDSDRRVVGNQLTWIYARPGEVKSCAGCHERPNSAPPAVTGIAALRPPLDFLPRGTEFTYRAKAWFKGSLPAEIEERTRTVRAVNLLAR